MRYVTKKGPSCANRTTLRNQHCELPCLGQCLTKKHTTFRGGILLLYPFFSQGTRQIPPLDVVERTFYEESTVRCPVSHVPSRSPDPRQRTPANVGESKPFNGLPVDRQGHSARTATPHAAFHRLARLRHRGFPEQPQKWGGQQ